jgi:4-hydroxy-3-methylbut-2-enyl diphosphate reductase
LDEKNVKVVDTTCPWVAKVWNTVHTHQVRGLTSVIHGKYAHEETMATKSMAETYICVKDVEEAEYLAEFILTAEEGDDGRKKEFMEKFSKSCSSHFDPHKHLQKIGLANQTTMYKKETRAIGQLLQKTIMSKFGPDLINEHYYEFDTICDATQVRQDAVDELCNMHDDAMQPSLDFILVVGGFDSSNTCHLLEIPQMRGVTSYHINAADCIQAENKIRHRTVAGEVIEDEGPFLTEDMLWSTDKETGEKTKNLLRVGVTSGASTPDKEVQDALGRIMMLNKLSEAGIELGGEKESELLEEAQ